MVTYSRELRLDSTTINLLLHGVKEQLIIDKLQQVLRSGEYTQRGYPTGKYRLILSGFELELLLEQLSDELINNGIENSGDLNARGYQIESLIDLLSDP